ncbi:hypothetical protein LTR36_001347 [Oleoguttula mirabilis]|uniref:Uncharacterized protein n=1 Tax=Oleoguttula mirabilis TaxID=1507867 RepID=A0AAV9JNI5_9PEZI|nr:hypothetical protein LTR36_001347 [Oleoguttula mirabilis]
MKLSLNTLAFLMTAATSVAQTVTIPATTGSLPPAGPNGCAAGYYPGTDTVLYTVPYTYQQVLSVIGNYTNLTWSGSPANSVTTNNSAALASNDWTPGTARFYDIAGAHVIETITTYSKPANGPYVEFHTLAPLRIASYDVDFYGDFDGQVWQPVCGGRATAANFTINFCASNATTGAAVLHLLHMTDAVTVGQYLGGQNYTSCAALGGNGTATGSNGTSAASGTATSSPAAVYTGAAVGQATGVLGALAVAGIVACANLCL